MVVSRESSKKIRLKINEFNAEQTTRRRKPFVFVVGCADQVVWLYNVVITRAKQADAKHETQKHRKSKPVHQKARLRNNRNNNACISLIL